MDVHYFDSVEDFEKLEDSQKWHDDVVTIVRHSNWLFADATRSDSDYKKLIKDFFKALSLYPEFDGWEKKIIAYLKSGLLSNNNMSIGNHKRNPDFSFSWAVEINEDRSYIFLNIKVDQYDER